MEDERKDKKSLSGLSATVFFRHHASKSARTNCENIVKESFFVPGFYLFLFSILILAVVERERERGRKNRKERGKERKRKKKVQKLYLVEVMDVALALELSQGRVLLERPAVELLVRRYDVDSGLFIF